MLTRRKFLKSGGAFFAATALTKTENTFAAFLGPDIGRAENWANVGKGQLTIYSTGLMNQQVLYRFGLDYKNYGNWDYLTRIMEARSFEDIFDLVINPILLDRMVTRLRSPLDVLKLTFDKAQTNRPYFIAPDILNINQATGMNINPEEFIGREVFLSLSGRYNTEGIWITESTHLPAIIMDVLDPKHRKPGTSFFADAGMNIFEQQGIKYNQGGGPYFTTLNGVAIRSLPIIEMQMDTNQFKY